PNRIPANVEILALNDQALRYTSGLDVNIDLMRHFRISTNNIEVVNHDATAFERTEDYGRKALITRASFGSTNLLIAIVQIIVSRTVCHNAPFLTVNIRSAGSQTTQEREGVSPTSCHRCYGAALCSLMRIKVFANSRGRSGMLESTTNT